MDFSTIVNEIIADVKRPDKRTSIKADVNRAISFVAAAGTFAADLVELTHNIDATLYAQSFDITASPFARFRKIKYIRPTGQSKFITWKDPSRVLDADGCESFNVWYRAGNNIVFSLSTLTPTLEIGYYQYHAALVADADTNWMLDQMYVVIHDIAMSYTLRGIGNKDEAANLFSLGMDMYRIFQRDLGDGVSHG